MAIKLPYALLGYSIVQSHMVTNIIGKPAACVIYPEEGGSRSLYNIVAIYITEQCHKPENHNLVHSTFISMLAAS
jgi:hypothetical protein